MRGVNARTVREVSVIKILMKSYLGNKRSSRIDFDYSDIRAKGARLVTSGGKAPGPQLNPLLRIYVYAFQRVQLQKVT